MGVAPVVVVIASVVTFSTHMMLGYDLTAAQVLDSRYLSVCPKLLLSEMLTYFVMTCWLLPLFQAFTVVTVFNAMTFALKVTPFSVKSLSEGSVALERFKVAWLPGTHLQKTPADLPKLLADPAEPLEHLLK